MPGWVVRFTVLLCGGGDSDAYRTVGSTGLLTYLWCYRGAEVRQLWYRYWLFCGSGYAGGLPYGWIYRGYWPILATSRFGQVGHGTWFPSFGVTPRLGILDGLWC